MTEEEIDKMGEDMNAAVAEGNWTKASNILSEMWLTFQIAKFRAEPSETKELTYFKIPVEFANGGKYLLTFMHVEGPKVQLKGDKDGE